MRRLLCAAAATTMLTGYAATAQADRIHLPSDPDIGLSIGTGAFIGNKKSQIEFERIQPPYFRLELTAFNRRNCRWFSRLNLYGSMSSEFVNLSYQNNLEMVEKEDDEGNTYEVQENGLKQADLAAHWNWSYGAGLRLSVFDDEDLFSEDFGLHIDVFGEFAKALRRIPTNPNTILVSWEGLELNIADIARENADIDLSWHMIHYGLAVGMPIQRWKGVEKLRLTPFIMAGYLHFNAGIHIQVHERFLRTLEALGVDPDLIPEEKTVDIDNFSASAGVRLDIGRTNALEASGAFIATRYGTRVYWATVSYSLRFDLW